LFPDEDYTFLKREGRKIIYKKKFPQGKKWYIKEKKE
jgi:hypothetical protein